MPDIMEPIIGGYEGGVSDYGVGVLLNVQLFGGTFEETVEEGDATDGVTDPAAVPPAVIEKRVNLDLEPAVRYAAHSRLNPVDSPNPRTDQVTPSCGGHGSVPPAAAFYVVVEVFGLGGYSTGDATEVDTVEGWEGRGEILLISHFWVWVGW
eukprot:CAMPEP_0118645718 /NCGR_PEP_ID=MMETSP0785-20121206/7655_1 /TAXON_ID=91992 /ORGANISM="Bolidomonas pacifica, Strain CCMP 1866" /LENGTH=151 /DNA_ID=CAMNT_0006537629 /DNA_START=100 /DNA_END=551 /DNA_ORIENTATION=+